MRECVQFTLQCPQGCLGCVCYHWRMLACYGISVLKVSGPEQFGGETTGDHGCSAKQFVFAITGGCFVSLFISIEIARAKLRRQGLVWKLKPLDPCL